MAVCLLIGTARADDSTSAQKDKDKKTEKLVKEVNNLSKSLEKIQKQFEEVSKKVNKIAETGVCPTPGKAVEPKDVLTLYLDHVSLHCKLKLHKFFEGSEKL